MTETLIEQVNRLYNVMVAEELEDEANHVLELTAALMEKELEDD